MILRIKPRPADPDSVQVVRLDDTDYQIRLTWYERTSRWLCAVATYPDLVPIIEAVTLCDSQLILRWADPAIRPQGELICVDLQPSEELPSRDDLGSRLELLYITADTVEELREDPQPFPPASSVVLL